MKLMVVIIVKNLQMKIRSYFRTAKLKEKEEKVKKETSYGKYRTHRVFKKAPIITEYLINNRPLDLELIVESIKDSRTLTDGYGTLACLFLWDRTKQGHNYWNKLDNELDEVITQWKNSRKNT